MLCTGVDMIEVERIRAAVARHGERFTQRIYTPREWALFGQNTASLAARWAAKEAVAKALGTGIGTVEWLEIEILRGPDKEPELHLHGKAQALAEQKGLCNWSLSISHTHDHAIAFVVAERHPPA